MDNRQAKLVVQVSNMLDDNHRLLKVIRLQLDQHNEAYAIFEELIANIEGLRAGWKLKYKAD